jgi:hypothetical protein
MSQYKGQGDPDQEELVPRTPIVISGVTFNPKACVHVDTEDLTGDAIGHHSCVHDWRCYWGNQNRPF